MVNSCETFFSSERFVKAWVAGWGQNRRPIVLNVRDGSRESVTHGVARLSRFGFAHAEFGPEGLYASPSPNWCDDEGVINRACAELERLRVYSLAWNVRFDHGSLAIQLQKAGFSCRMAETNVLSLEKKHEDLFKGYRQTRRNEIRRFFRQGAKIQRAHTPAEVHAYCRVHQKLARQKKGFEIKHPVTLIEELVKLRDDVILLLAEFEDKIVAGALFFIDGNSMLYWHGAADREFAHLFPAGALVDKGIQTACEHGLETFNFGGSGTVSLAQFKESFSANTREVWNFFVTLKKPFLLTLSNGLKKFYAERKRAISNNR